MRCSARFGSVLIAENQTFTGAWLMLLAFMVWQSARMALSGTAAASARQGVSVGDIMDHEPVVIRAPRRSMTRLDESSCATDGLAAGRRR